jgi:hypothetical protein
MDPCAFYRVQIGVPFSLFDGHLAGSIAQKLDSSGFLDTIEPIINHTKAYLCVLLGP